MSNDSTTGSSHRTSRLQILQLGVRVGPRLWRRLPNFGRGEFVFLLGRSGSFGTAVGDQMDAEEPDSSASQTDHRRGDEDVHHAEMVAQHRS